MNNLDIYKKDLDNLIQKWEALYNSMQYNCFPENFLNELNKYVKKKDISQYIGNLPIFEDEYQSRYSESLSIIKQLLPDRLNDFTSLFNKNKNRKSITHENYCIEDYLQWIAIYHWSGMEKDRSSGIPKFRQQINILKSIQKRFESSLFDIKQLVQADLFDSEIDVAEELCKKWFYRASWAVLWVVLESHLQQIIENHNLEIKKKNPMLNDLTEILKSNNIIQVPEWRKLQHLADIRNTCDHKKGIEPKKEDIEDLINWVKRAIKNIF